MWIAAHDHPGWLVIAAQPLPVRGPDVWRASILGPQSGYGVDGPHAEQSVILTYGGEDWWMELG